VSFPYETRPNEYTIGKSGKRLYLATRTGSTWKQKLLAENADWPAWSPDGRRLAFHRDGLAVMDMSTRRTRILVPDKVRETVHEPSQQIHYPLSWSPDGRYLIYVTAYYEGSQARVLDTRTGKPLAFDLGSANAWVTSNSVLSSQWGGVDAPAEASWIRRIQLPSGTSRTILPDHSALSVFVPGQAGYAWLWMKTNPPSGEGIYRMDLKSGGLTKLLSVCAEEWYWDPTGRQFAFIGRASSRPGEEPRMGLYVGITHNFYYKGVASDAAMPSGNTHDMMKYVGWARDGRSLAYVSNQGDIRVLSTP
jgi:Tol biopolymer transport system component